MSWISALPSNSSGWREWNGPEGIKLDVFYKRGEVDGPVALITAGVHGDEYEGPVAIAELARRLSGSGVCGTVVLVPVVNPAAFDAATRTSPIDGLNLARTFPGRASGKPTERLAFTFFEEFVTDADFLIDLHSGGKPYLFRPLAGFYGPPSRGNPSFVAAQGFGLPVLWQLPATPGVLSFEACKRGKVAIGNEYLGGGLLSATGVRAYTDGVLSCLGLWGLLPESQSTSRSAEVFEGNWILAGRSGLFTTERHLGEPVQAGAELAQIRNIRGETIETITAPQDGVVLGLRVVAHIDKGDWAVLVGRRAEAEP